MLVFYKIVGEVTIKKTKTYIFFIKLKASLTTYNDIYTFLNSPKTKSNVPIMVTTSANIWYFAT